MNRDYHTVRPYRAYRYGDAYSVYTVFKHRETIKEVQDHYGKKIKD